MKILQINFSFGKGGAGLASRSLCQGLKSIRCELRYFSASGFTTNIPNEESFFRRLKRNIAWRPFKALGISDSSYPPFLPKSLKEGAMWADIIHIHNIHGGYFNLSWLRQLSKIRPVVWSLHDDWILTGHCAYPLDCDKWMKHCGKCPYKKTYPGITLDTTTRIHAFKREILHASKPHLVFSSKWMEKRALLSGYDNIDTSCIGYGLESFWLESFSRENEKAILGIPAHTRTIVVALHEKNIFKGGELLRQAFSLMKKQDQPLIILAVGKVSDNYYDTSQIPVKYYGDVSLTQFHKIMMASDILVIPSIADSSPLVVKQSMAMGTAVVAFEVGGIPEMLLDSNAGLLAKINAPEDLADKMCILLNDQNLLSKLSKNGISYAKDNFKIESYVQKYNNLYQKIIINQKD
jgi:glycosyltransferase involved in cell wall biosynthesis